MGPNPLSKPTASWEVEGDSRAGLLHKSHDLNPMTASEIEQTWCMLTYANLPWGGNREKDES